MKISRVFVLLLIKNLLAGFVGSERWKAFIIQYIVLLPYKRNKAVYYIKYPFEKWATTLEKSFAASVPRTCLHYVYKISAARRYSNDSRNSDTMSLSKSSILLWMSRMNNPFHSSGRGECVKVSRKQQGKNRKRCMDRFDRLHSPNSWEFRSELPSFLPCEEVVQAGEGQGLGEGEGRDRELRILF